MEDGIDGDVYHFKEMVCLKSYKAFLVLVGVGIFLWAAMVAQS